MNVPLIKPSGIASPLHIRFIPASPRSNPRSVRKTFLQTILAVAISVLAPIVAHAGSATWDLNPVSGDWNTAANWTPMGVPNGPADVATFGLSDTTDVSISANTEVNGIIFTPAATNPYTITANPGLTLTISGVGIVNNSGVVQNFVAAADFNSGNSGTIVFSHHATAGSNVSISNEGEGAFITFQDHSTADSATIFQNLFGHMFFTDHSTAGSAIIDNGVRFPSPAFQSAVILNEVKDLAHDD